jgi:predicted alpha/beta superfamily hydrolase
MTPRPVVTLVLLLASAVATAQPAPASGDVVVGRREVVHSTILNEDRPILVSMPRPPATGAPPAAPTRFPVMVLLDGDWQFEHTVAAARFLAGNGLIPPIIVVGVMNVDRGRDLMPHLVGGDFVEGPSDRFLDFLADELLPYVDRTYPTLPYRLLVGHSNAGMFSLYALIRRPGVFSAHFVMSPSFGQSDRFVAALDRFLASRQRLDAFVYVSAGDEEPDVSVGAIRFAKALEAGAPAGLEWHYEYFKGESHGSVVHKAVYRGLELLGFADAVPPTAAAAFLPKAELRRRAWVQRFGSDFGTPRMPRASIAGPLLRVLGEGGSGRLAAQYAFMCSSEPDTFRFDAVELENLRAWLASEGRSKDAEEVRALSTAPVPAAATAAVNEYGSRVDLARGLVVHYPLDGHAGEASGRGPEGRVQGATPVDDRRGRAAGAFRFDGVDDRIEIPAPERLAGGGSVTVSAWVRPRGRVAYGAWVSKATRPYGSQWRVGFASNPDVQWGLTLFNGRWSDYWVAEAPVPDGEWTHVVATADQTIGRVRYYVNGQPAGGSSALQPFLASSAPLFVGFQQDDGVYYSGDVDDLRVWDRVLSPAEVEALFREK